MYKRKSLSDQSELPIALKLDEEQIEALQLIKDTLNPSLKCLLPVLETIRKAHDDVFIPPHRRALPVNATTLHGLKTELRFSRLAKQLISSALPPRRKCWELISRKMMNRMFCI